VQHLYVLILLPYGRALHATSLLQRILGNARHVGLRSPWCMPNHRRYHALIFHFGVYTVPPWNAIMPDSWLKMKETRGVLLGRRQRAHVADACVCSESLQKQHTLTSAAASSPTPLGPPTQGFPHACRWPARGSIFGHSSRDCPGNWLGHKISAAAAWVLFESNTPVALYKLQPVLG